MNMKYTLLSADEIDSIKGFLSDDDYEGFVNNPFRQALCAVDDNRLCGVGIFDARKVAEILDIITVDDMRGKLEQKILQRILVICDALPCDAVTMDVYDEDGALLFDEILTEEGFRHVSATTIYRFELSDLDDNPVLSKASPGDDIITLDSATDQMKKVFSNELIKEGAYDHFMNEDHDPFMSVVSVKDGVITGCVLVDDLQDEYGFELAYLYSRKSAGPANIVNMLAGALDNVNDRYSLPEAVGYITAMGTVSDGLVKKVLPGARINDHINRYARI